MKEIYDAFEGFATFLLVLIVILSLIGIVGLLSTICDRMKIIAGSLSMIAVALNERCDSDPDQRIIFKQLGDTIYYAITNAKATRN